jgi:transposase
MEGRRRRSFTEDYKRQAVEILISRGRPVASVAKELGLRDSILRRWAEKLGRQPTAAQQRTITQAANENVNELVD